MSTVPLTNNKQSVEGKGLRRTGIAGIALGVQKQPGHDSAAAALDANTVERDVTIIYIDIEHGRQPPGKAIDIRKFGQNCFMATLATLAPSLSALV